mgnify:CR=1 FL=1
MSNITPVFFIISNLISLSSIPSAIFFFIVSSIRNIDCGIYAVNDIHDFRSFFIGVLFANISPLLGFKNPNIMSISVVLPDPVEPTIALFVPGLKCIDRLFNILEPAV